MIKKRMICLSLSLFSPVFIGVLFLAAFTANSAYTAPDATITVSNLNDGGAGSLRQAISDATDGDTIDFSVNGTIAMTSSLVITKSITIDGGGAITVSGNNIVRVFNVMTSTLSPSVAVTFDNLTIADGNVQAEDCAGVLDLCGGGIMLQNSGVVVTVTNSTLSANSASVGGGIFNANGSLLVMNSSLANNSAMDSGGGIFNSDGIVTVMNSALSDNTAVTGDGGGIYMSDIGSMTIRNSTLSNNAAATTGGGIRNAGTVMITHSTLSGNSANYGGGMMNTNNPDGIVTIDTSTLSDNSASRGGGGIYSSEGTVLVNNSTITANRVGDGYDGAAGIGAYGDTDTFTTITNTIVSGNIISGTTTPDDIKLVDGVDDSFTSGGHNLIGAIGPNIDAFVDGVNGDQTEIYDPQIGPLADNGGDTLTHALWADSPALDAGSDSCGDTDQRGVPRPQNGICDIGAYEKQVYQIFLPVIFNPAE